MVRAKHIKRKILIGVFWTLAVFVWLFLVFLNFYPVGSLFKDAVRESTKIYDRNGVLLYETLHEGAGKTTQIGLAHIPAHLINATIATEDANFYTNPGVDFGGILRAMYLNLRGGGVVSGGSTITQQLIRNVIGTEKRRSVLQKIKESFLALRVNKVFSKEEILQLYFNRIYYGNLHYGVSAAAWGYFGKQASDLDLAESAFLAGLPQAPNRYNPFIYRDAALARKDYVLTLMQKNNFISEEEMNQAKAEKLAFEKGNTRIRAPHFVHYAIEELEDRFGPDFASKGLKVKTTLDYNLYEKSREIARRKLADLVGRNVTNAAVVILDNQSGEVVNMLGSADYFNESIEGNINMTTASRQPGSAMKPITYALAFEKGWTPATLVIDEPVRFFTADGTPYLPKNYDYEYHGKVTVREALGNSFNIPAVKAADFVGVENLLAKAREMGLSTLNDTADHYGLALTLGDAEVRLLDLTAAYAIFANGGIKKEPLSIASVHDENGALIYEAPRPRGTRVLGEDVSFMITDILSDPAARAAEFGLNTILEIDRPAAAKTGTTRNFRDNWTVGYTPQFTVGVWVGNSDNSEMRNISGVYGAGPIWHDVMEEIHRGKEKKAFAAPEMVIEQNGDLISRRIPPLHSAEQPDSAHGKPALTIKKPFDLDVFQFNPAISGEVQQIKLQAEKTDPEMRVTWFINGKSAGRGDEIFWKIEEGEFEIVAEGKKNGEIIRSEKITISVE